MRVDLNCDMGESFGIYQIGDDEGIMAHITSANIACGFHGGDPMVMERTVMLAKRNGVAVGAHPGYPDLQGFGRRNMIMDSHEIEHMIIYQLGALDAFCQKARAPMIHVKPHGALYNMAAKDKSLAKSIAKAVYTFDQDLILVGLAGSSLIEAGMEQGLLVAREAFADRQYLLDGSLAPRSIAGAVIHDADIVAQRALKMTQEHSVVSMEGHLLTLEFDTLCIHGDTPGAAALASSVRQSLMDAGIIVIPMGSAID